MAALTELFTADRRVERNDTCLNAAVSLTLGAVSKFNFSGHAC